VGGAAAAHEELGAIARRFGVKVGTANRREPGLTGGPLTRTARLGALGLPVRAYANDEWLVFEITRETSLCFAGPVTERILGCEHPLGTFSGIPIFVPFRLAQTEQADQTADWFESQARFFAGAINADGERFLVANNKTILYVRPSGVSNDTQRLDALITAVGRLPASGGDTPPLALPEQFRDLGPVTLAWALSDDDERSEAIGRGSDDELEALWRTVSPLLTEIDGLLDTSHDAAEFVVLADLAQAAHEAHDELARRGRTAI
jgi:hypothetical protein